MSYYDELMKKSTKPCEPNDRVNHRFTIVENVFSSEECKKVLDMFDEYDKEIGIVGKPSIEDDTNSEYTNVFDSNLRNCYVTYVDKTDKNKWIHDRIEKCIKEENEKYWKCQITDYSQPMRLMTYKKDQHFGSWHQDNGVKETSFRKLTAILQVSDPKDYEGGEFQISGSEELPPESKKQGNIIIFPCYLLHRVTKVTKGTRHSVVHRAIGEPFR